MVKNLYGYMNQNVYVYVYVYIHDEFDQIKNFHGDQG
jgi:hypothetical protein